MSIPGANPPDHDPGMRTVSEATRCVCGHRWDDHYPAHRGATLGQLHECIGYGGFVEACDPHRFKPDDLDER